MFKRCVHYFYIALVDNPNSAATLIHLGYRLGRDRLIELLQYLRANPLNVLVEIQTFNVCKISSIVALNVFIQYHVGT